MKEFLTPWVITTIVWTVIVLVALYNFKFKEKDWEETMRRHTEDDDGHTSNKRK